MLAEDSEPVTEDTAGGSRPRIREKPLSNEGRSILELDRSHVPVFVED